ncbi:MAG: LytR/AlgR family response regulator transcription factor [Eubacteriaceae bacterium]
MRVYICDDLKKDRELLKKYYCAYAEEESIEFVIEEYECAERFLERFKESKTEPTLVFLDIYMEKMTGIEAARKICDNGFSGNLIFTTTSTDHAVESYDLGAEGYLKKPYEYSSFVKTMNRLKQNWEQSLKHMIVCSDRVQFRVLLQKIESIESNNHCCYIHGDKESIKTRKRLKEFEEELKDEEAFIRCGRSMIINLNAVKSCTGAEEFIFLKSGKKIFLPIRERTKIKGLIADYYWKRVREN